MVFGRVGHRLEADAVELVGHGEDAFCHGVHSEIGADGVFIQVIFLAAHFFGEIVVVPRLDLEIVAETV